MARARVDPVSLVGAVLGAVAIAIMAITRIYDYRGRLAARRLPATSIADAKPGMLTVRGTIALAGATVEGLFAPADAVMVRVIIERSSTEGWTEVHREDRVVPFLLDDGSGTIALVDPTGPHMLSERTERFSSGPSTPDARVLEWARRHSLDAAGETLRVTIEVVLRDDEVSVHGLATPTEDAPSPYRGIAPRILIAKPDDGAWMFVTHEPVAALAASGRLNAAD